MSVKVCKFGGTSMADAGVIAEVKKIIESHDDKQSETTIIKKNTVGLR